GDTTCRKDTAAVPVATLHPVYKLSGDRIKWSPGGRGSDRWRRRPPAAFKLEEINGEEGRRQPAPLHGPCRLPGRRDPVRRPRLLRRLHHRLRRPVHQ
ncbi:hypothetical protein Taro_054107, partial [Colocasia esculenta]|nr:hypothetical protein [Colocasia esculenta]